MVPWRSSGDVLRWWREDVLALTQQQAADRLNVQPSSLSNWERDARAISIDLDDLDEALKGEGVLRGLLWASRTPEGLEPGHLWTRVFPGPSCPVWVWIRGSSPKVFIQAEWGVARIDTVLELGPNGAFVTVGASVSDSPVVLYLSEPVWADFGYGELPDQVPGAPVLPAVSIFSASSADGRFMEFFRSRLQAEVTDPKTNRASLSEVVPDSIKTFVATRGPREPVTEPHKNWPINAEGIDAVERQRFARLREARQMSRAAVALRLSTLTDTEVSRDTVRRFEIDVGKPHDPMLPVALDHVLGADGRLGVLEIRSGQGLGTVKFPPYWRGPIWLAFDPSQAESDAKFLAVLHRGRWRRDLVITGPMLLAVHWFDPEVPLRIEVADGMTWRVGVGRRSGATSIDQNWEPSSVDIAEDAVLKAQEAIMTAAERDRRPQGR